MTSLDLIKAARLHPGDPANEAPDEDKTTTIELRTPSGAVSVLTAGGNAAADFPGVVVLPAQSDDRLTQRDRCARLRASGFFAVSLPPAHKHDPDAIAAAIDHIVGAATERGGWSLAAVIASDSPAHETWIIASPSTLLLAALLDGPVPAARLRHMRGAGSDASASWASLQFPTDAVLQYFESAHISATTATDRLIAWDDAAGAVKAFLT